MYTQRDDNWDLSIYNRELQLVLAVEVKSQLNITKEWATKFRRNVLAHEVFAKAPYFLIIFPDKLYLWTNDNGVLPLKEPTYIVDARPIFRPHFEQSGITANQISSENLEIIVTSWLAKIMYSSKPPSLDDESHGWLVDSGLYNAIAGGSFNREAVA